METLAGSEAVVVPSFGATIRRVLKVRFIGIRQPVTALLTRALALDSNWTELAAFAARLGDLIPVEAEISGEHSELLFFDWGRGNLAGFLSQIEELSSGSSLRSALA